MFRPACRALVVGVYFVDSYSWRPMVSTLYSLYVVECGIARILGADDDDDDDD